MTGWVAAGVIAALAVAVALPAVLRGLALMRSVPPQFETPGAANDPQF